MKEFNRLVRHKVILKKKKETFLDTTKQLKDEVIQSVCDYVCVCVCFQ